MRKYNPYLMSVKDHMEQNNWKKAGCFAAMSNGS